MNAVRPMLHRGTAVILCVYVAAHSLDKVVNLSGGTLAFACWLMKAMLQTAKRHAVCISNIIGLFGKERMDKTKVKTLSYISFIGSVIFYIRTPWFFCSLLNWLWLFNNRVKAASNWDHVHICICRFRYFVHFFFFVCFFSEVSH